MVEGVSAGLVAQKCTCSGTVYFFGVVSNFLDFFLFFVCFFFFLALKPYNAFNSVQRSYQDFSEKHTVKSGKFDQEKTISNANCNMSGHLPNIATLYQCRKLLDNLVLN